MNTATSMRTVAIVIAAVVVAMPLLGCPQSPTVTVPDVTGMDEVSAQDALQDAGLELGQASEEYSGAVAEGNVIEQTPEAQATVEEGSGVDIVVSLGPEPLPEKEAAEWIAPSVDVSQVDADTSGNVTDATATQHHHADGSSEYRVISAMDDPQAVRSRIEARGTDDSLLGLYRYLGTVIFVNRIQDADDNVYLALTAAGTGGVYETSLGSFTLPMESASTNFGVHTIGPVNEAETAEIQADMPASITHVEDIPILVFEEFVSGKRGIGLSYPDNVRVKTVGDPHKSLGNLWDQMWRSTPELVLNTAPGLRAVQQLTRTIQFAVSSARFALDVKDNLDPAAGNLGEVRANYGNAEALEGGVSLETMMAQHSALVDPSGEQTDVPLLAGSLLEGLSARTSNGSESAVEALGESLWGDGTGLAERLSTLVDDINMSAEVYFYWIGGEESGLYARAGSRDIKLAGSLLDSVIAAIIGDSDVLPDADPAVLQEGLDLAEAEGKGGSMLRCGAQIEGAVVTYFLRSFPEPYTPPAEPPSDVLAWGIEVSAGLAQAPSIAIQYNYSDDAWFSARHTATPSVLHPAISDIELAAHFPLFGRQVTLRVDTAPEFKPYGFLAFEPTVPGIKVGLGAGISVQPDRETLQKLEMTPKEAETHITDLLADAAHATEDAYSDVSFSGDGMTMHMPENMFAATLAGILTRVADGLGGAAESTSVKLQLLVKGGIGPHVEAGYATVGLNGGITLTMPLDDFEELLSFALKYPNPVGGPIGFASVVSNPDLAAASGAAQRAGFARAISFVRDLVLSYHVTMGDDAADLFRKISGDAEVAFFGALSGDAGVVLGAGAGVDAKFVVSTGYNLEYLVFRAQSLLCNRGWALNHPDVCEFLDTLNTGADPRVFLRGVGSGSLALQTQFQLMKIGRGQSGKVFSLEIALDNTPLEPEVQVDLAADTMHAAPGETVTFTGAAQPGKGLSISHYEWDFTGDGAIDETTTDPDGARFDYTYPAPGDYMASVIAVASNGAEATAQWHVTVEGDDPGDTGPGETETIMLPGDVPLEMVRIPAGTFMMGRYPDEQDSNDLEDPQHEVTIGYDFWMGKYPITQAQWEAVMGNNPSEFQGPNRPVELVSWNEIRLEGGFLEQLNAAHPGHGVFRLPSEAEWEYAYRAGTTTRFYWGDDPDYTEIDDYAWYSANSGSQTHDVGQKLPNAWGLYDMSGNVWELCEDDWHRNYEGAPADGSAWVDEPRARGRVLRGGSLYSYAFRCRAANRNIRRLGLRYNRDGFRVVLASD